MGVSGREWVGNLTRTAFALAKSEGRSLAYLIGFKSVIDQIQRDGCFVSCTAAVFADYGKEPAIPLSLEERKYIEDAITQGVLSPEQWIEYGTGIAHAQTIFNKYRKETG